MNILLWIIFGGLAGWLAGLLVGTHLGVFWSIIVGIIGAFIGGWIMDAARGRPAEGAQRPTSLWSFVTAVIGAVLLLLIVNLIY